MEIEISGIMKDYSLPLTAFLRSGTLFTDDDLDEAEDRAERLGGSVPDHLYILEADNENKLLQAMSECFGWSTVSISGLEPSPDALGLISGETAWETKALPFAVDADTGLVRIACLNPEDSGLRQQLEDCLPGRTIELHAAVGPALDCAIIDCYRRITSEADSDSGLEGGEADAREGYAASEKTALLVDPEWDGRSHLAGALIDEDYLVVACQTPSEALEEFESRRPRLILIKDIHRVRYQKLLERSAELTPDCTVRFFSDMTDLLSPVPTAADRDLLLNNNLHLATAAMASVAGRSPEESVRTGRYVDRLCQRLRIDSYTRLVLVSTAYLLDISRLYFRDEPPSDRETMLYRMLTAAGNNLIHSPAVLKMIRRMYPDLNRMKAEDVRSEETAHGNILTVVDFYLKHFGGHKRLTPHRYESIQHNLRAQIGEILVPEITEAFLELLHEEVDYSRHDRSKKEILVLDELGVASSALTDQMNSAGFECIVTMSLNQFLYRFNQHRPDFITILARGGSEQVQRLISYLAASGIVFPDIPSFVFHESSDSSLIAPLLEMGVRDAFRFHGDCGILRVRLQQILAARERESLERLQVFQDMGTHGSLEHMNVIDLLQAVGPGDKTLRISVTARAKQLTMYLDHGKLLYAECDGNTGASAIFEALSWDAGIWSVDHIKPSDLPEPNNERSIDSILIEGCTNIDELGQSKAPSEETAPAPVF